MTTFNIPNAHACNTVAENDVFIVIRHTDYSQRLFYSNRPKIMSAKEMSSQNGTPTTALIAKHLMGR